MFNWLKKAGTWIGEQGRLLEEQSRTQRDRELAVFRKIRDGKPYVVADSVLVGEVNGKYAYLTSSRTNPVTGLREGYRTDISLSTFTDSGDGKPITRLYETPSGEFFILVFAQPRQSGMTMVHGETKFYTFADRKEAMRWAEDHLQFDAYVAYFGREP